MVKPKATSFNLFCAFFSLKHSETQIRQNRGFGLVVWSWGPRALLFGRFVQSFDSNKWSLVLFFGVVTTPAKTWLPVFFFGRKECRKTWWHPHLLEQLGEKKNPPLAVFGVGKFVSSSNSQCAELGHKSFPTFLREIQGWWNSCAPCWKLDDAIVGVVSFKESNEIPWQVWIY